MNNTHPSHKALWQAPSALFVALAALAALFAWQFQGILTLADGFFSYALDDAYIHLALSENIMKGHYGVNLQDYSAPSSSILWSFIMAPLATWQFWPLTVNIILSVIALGFWHKLVNQVLPQESTGLKIALNICFLFMANLVGVSFTGMENVLQLVVSMVIVAGLFRLIEDKTYSWCFLLSIIIAPLVRYETISLSCIGLLFLLLNRHFITAIATGIFMLIPLVGFSLYLNSLDLGYLPSSITAKSSAMQASAIVSTITNFYNNFYEPTGSLLIGLLLPLIWAGLTRWKQEPQITVLSIMISAAVLAHLALGRIGNWGRYEIYIWISLLMTLLYVFQAPLRNWLQKPTFHPVFFYAALLMFTVLFAKRYLVTSTMSKVGGANIALQQHQMHRFAVDFWKGDVAVNDLGWVSYQNDNYVLDLWGLANKEALDMRKAGTPDMLAKLTEKHNIQLAMIYQMWFNAEIPSTWVKVATLNLPEDMRAMTPADSQVQFYATSANAVPTIAAAVSEFQQSLPSGVTITKH